MVTTSAAEMIGYQGAATLHWIFQRDLPNVTCLMRFLTSVSFIAYSSQLLNKCEFLNIKVKHYGMVVTR
jgi:hypothetical protein